MAVFISHSHQDAKFVDTLALSLVKAHAHVWLDRWELKVGDSIVRRIEEAITTAGALVVVLSRASVESEWCRKELSAGLVRELEERQVIVLPVLLEDCQVPLFLRDKLYADFRKGFEPGLKQVLHAIARVAHDDRARFASQDDLTDWAVDYASLNDHPILQFTFIQHPKTGQHTVLTEVHVVPNDVAAARLAEYAHVGLEWLGRHVIVEFVTDALRDRDLRVLIPDARPATLEVGVGDSKIGYRIEIGVTCRLLGVDPGHDILVNVAGLLASAAEHMRNSSRPLTADEARAVVRIQARPVGK